MRKRISNGKHVLTASGRLAVCAPCDTTDECGEYIASDGNEYSDDFTDISGWTDDSSGVTMSATGGRARGTSVSGFNRGTMYRTAEMTDECLLVVLEANIYKGTITTGGYIGIWVVEAYRQSLGADHVALNAHLDESGNWNGYVMRVDGLFTTLAPTPADGDKITILVKKTVAGYRVCAYINDVLEFDEDQYAPMTLPDDINYGIECSFLTGSGHQLEWDNFSIHVGNP